MSDELTSISKFLSLVLRHKPETIGLTISPQGWVNIDELLSAASMREKLINRELLDDVVFTNDKQRFAYSPDGRFIRANQGHSIQVDLELEPCSPPNVLYHGTSSKSIERIREKGLLKMTRNHVHLSTDEETAHRVGVRKGKPVILLIDSKLMADDGLSFYVSNNGVWLTDNVPTKYITEK